MGKHRRKIVSATPWMIFCGWILLACIVIVPIIRFGFKSIIDILLVITMAWCLVAAGVASNQQSRINKEGKNSAMPKWENYVIKSGFLAVVIFLVCFAIDLFLCGM